jgi:hypothetical protein
MRSYVLQNISSRCTPTVKVPDREAAARLGRYMIRCPVVLERMSPPRSLAGQDSE